MLFNREDDDDELWDFWVPCCTGKLISHDNGLMALMVGTLRIPWVMALVEDDPSTYDGSSALLHLECTIASHVFLCAFFLKKSMLPMFVGCIHVFSLVDYIPGALLALGT